MIEFFVANAIAEKFNNKNEYFNTPTPSHFDMSDGSFVVGLIVSLLISVITAYIAYQCNLNDKPAIRFLVTLFAFFFSGIYLIYYFIIYVLLGGSCNGNNNFMNGVIPTRTKRKGKSKKKPTRK